MKMQIVLDDQKDLERFLNKELKNANKNADKVLKLTTKHIEGQAKQLAPVGNYPSHWARKGGWLRKNITSQKNSGIYEVQSNADYSMWVEYGNRWHKGTSFFRPAINFGFKYMEQQIKKLI